MIAETVRRPAMRAPLASLGEIVFLGSVVVQGLHFAEHISQVVQKFFLGLPQADGILGAAFDLEWVHFGYNLALLLSLWFVVGALWAGGSGWAPRALWLAAGIQTYHVAEHGLKLAQHLTAGCHSCPGLLGQFGDLVWIHFTINLLVIAPMLVALMGMAGRRGGAESEQRPLRQGGFRWPLL